MDQTTNSAQKGPMPPPVPILNLKSGLYWSERPGYLGSIKPRAVILTVQDGEISLKTRDTEIFRVPVKSIAVKFRSDMMMEMILLVNGVQYTLLGEAGGLAERFSDAQIAELNASQQPGRLAARGVGTAVMGSAVRMANPNAVGRAAGSTMQAAGLGLAMYGIYKTEKSLEKWEQVFANNGVVFKHKTYHTVWIIVLISIILSGGLYILGVMTEKKQ